jgi:hypothetical protein
VLSPTKRVWGFAYKLFINQVYILSLYKAGFQNYTNMKKIILAIVITFLSATLFAQDDKPCLFIASTSIKHSICSDYKWVKEGVADNKEFSEKLQQFKDENKANSYAIPGGLFVGPTESAIVYEFKARHGAFNCSPLAYNFIKGKTIENCIDQLNVRVLKNPNDYETQPIIIFKWTGKGIAAKKL